MARLVTVEGKNANKDNMNGIQIHIDHSKHKKCASVTYYPCQIDGERVIVAVTQGIYTYGEAMARANNAKLQSIQDEVRKQVALKDGQYWTEVVKAAAKFGITL